MVSKKISRMMKNEALLLESFADEKMRCPVTGKKDNKSSKRAILSKKKLTKYEMDKIFLDF